MFAKVLANFSLAYVKLRGPAGYYSESNSCAYNSLSNFVIIVGDS